MRGVDRPAPRQHSPQDRSGVRFAGHAGAAVVRVATVVAAAGVIATTTAWPALARTAGDRSVTGPAAAGAPASGPMILGLGPMGLLWLLAGLLALVVGLVLATRRSRPTSAPTGPFRPSKPASHDRSGGAKK